MLRFAGLECLKALDTPAVYGWGIHGDQDVQSLTCRERARNVIADKTSKKHVNVNTLKDALLVVAKEGSSRIGGAFDQRSRDPYQVCSPCQTEIEQRDTEDPVTGETSWTRAADLSKEELA